MCPARKKVRNMIQKTIYNKTPNFNQDLKKLESLSNSDSFVDQVIEEFISQIRSKSHLYYQKNKVDFHYLLFWNRFNGMVKIIQTQVNSPKLPFDSDLFSYFHLMTLTTKNLSDVLFENNLLTLVEFCSEKVKDYTDFNELVPYFIRFNDLDKLQDLFRDTFKKLISKTISEIYILSMESISIDNFSDSTLDKFNKKELFPIDFLSTKKQYKLFWRFWTGFRTKNKDLNKVDLPIINLRKNGDYSEKGKYQFDSVIFKDDKLVEPFENYLEQMIDYSFEIIFSLDQDLISKQALINFLEFAYDRTSPERAKEIKKILIQFEEFYTTKIVEDDLRKLDNYINKELYNYAPLAYDLKSKFWNNENSQRKILDKFLEFLQKIKGTPLNFQYKLPEFIYKEARKERLLVEGSDNITFYLKQAIKKSDAPVIYSPFFGYCIGKQELMDYFQCYIEEFESLLLSNNVLTTKEIKLEIMAIKSLKMIRFSNYELQFLDTILNLEEAW